MSFADRVIRFTLDLRLPDLPLPPGFSWLFPYGRADTIEAMTTFYRRFYADDRPRAVLFGINPGRFGAGVTGVPFTDPIRLEAECGIKNDFPKKPELSSVFVWQFINAYGGIEAFSKKFYITSLLPLGLVKDGKNINYYDDRALERAVEPYMIWNIRTQLDFGLDRQAAVCLGEGQNYRVFKKLNDTHGFFQEIIPLPHPRFIMQYRRKTVDQFIQRYVQTIRQIGY